MNSGQHESAQRIAYDESVFDAVAGAYYPAAVGAGDAARRRAQAAQSVSSAVSAGLIAAVALSQPESLKDFQLVSAWLAVSSWALASVLYARAVSTPVGTRDLRELGTKEQLVRFVLEQALKDRKRVQRRQSIAGLVAALALAATVTTFVLVTWPSSKGGAGATLFGTSSAGDLVTKACGAVTNRIHVQTSYPESTIDGREFTVTIDDDACPHNGSTVLLPASNAVLVLDNE